MIWANGYVGIPFAELGRSRAGCDCWGLARLVYRQELGIDLPSYAGGYAGTAERAEIAGLIAHATGTSVWQPVQPCDAFDLILFRTGRYDSHIGIALDARRMLHMEAGAQARIVDTDAPRWRCRRVGAFRHARQVTEAMR